jgi:hypothetical protein
MKDPAILATMTPARQAILLQRGHIQSRMFCDKNVR